MTKAELISRVSEKTGIRREEVEKIIESLFLTIKDSMSNGDNIYFRGFGSFVNKQRAAKLPEILNSRLRCLYRLRLFLISNHLMNL